MNAIMHELEVGLRRKIRRNPLREQIAQGLAELVASGLLRPGDELPSERELSGVLEVSRESLRSALQLLAERGILEIGHGTKTRVCEVPTGLADGDARLLPRIEGMDDRSVFEARRLIEPALAYEAAGRIGDVELARLERMVEAQALMLDDPVRFQISDRQFHTLIFQVADNPVLERFAGEAYGHAYTYRREIIEHKDGVRVGVEAHRAIVAALRLRDPEAAKSAMLAHVDMIAVLLTKLPARARISGARHDS